MAFSPALWLLLAFTSAYFVYRLSHAFLYAPVRPRVVRTTPVGWMAAVFGVVTAMAGVALVVVDVVRSDLDRETESVWFLAALQRWPICLIPLGMIAFVAVGVGALLGHLSWPRDGEVRGTGAALGVFLVGIGLGLYAGHRIFGQ